MTTTRIQVPLLDLKAQYASLREEIRPVIDEIFESQWFIGGPHVTGLEEDLAAYVGGASAVGCSSGTDALILALMALGVEAGDEVVTTPYTFFATIGSIARLGAVPRFVDIDPETYNIDLSGVEKAVNERTKVILPVHLFGQCVEMEALTSLADAAGIPVVEDAAQAIGARDAGGGKAGSLGRVGCFSFFPSKNLGGAGDGGMVTTVDEDLGHRMAVLRNHGMEPKYYHSLLGGNFRLDAIQAAVLRVKLAHLDEWHEKRRGNASDYRRLFEEAGLLDRVSLPKERDGVYHIYNQFVIRVSSESRDDLVEHLHEMDIGCEVYYPVPCHLQKCFAGWGYGAGDFPESEKAALETLALPIYPELNDEQKAAVVDGIAEFFS
ncbi:MAG: DegT/DnrJ/EryC1/StrS family aminotransferase [Planctomycetota bacterium]|nr:DegT/DnrJ/EryC1/StrS family aminotransferase [Planctomycetota bacterium]